MNKKITALALYAVLLALCFSAEAQQPGKILRIGYLSGSDQTADLARAEPFRTALRELGYLDGQNLAIEYDMRKGTALGYRSLRPSWCVSRSMSS
jgi:hypothetical protein